MGIGNKRKKTWQEVISNDNFQYYLEKYPQGKYAQQAKDSSEEKAWQEAKETGSYEFRYLSKYPDGKYAQQAKDSVEVREKRKAAEDKKLEQKRLREVAIAQKNNQISGKRYKVVASGGLLLRRAASRSSEYILVIPQNTYITASEETYGSETVEGTFGYWRKVAYNGNVGYVFDGFLERYLHYRILGCGCSALLLNFSVFFSLLSTDFFCIFGKKR